MRILLIGDVHIDEPSIEEINTIFNKDIYSIKADEVIQLGDLFNSNRPTPKEIKFATELIHKLSILNKKVTLLAGNGSHEFLNGVAVIEYLKELSGKIEIITEEHFIRDNIYYGHHMLHESKLEYGTGKCGLKDLKKYNYAILGHQHSFQKFNSKVYHIGSMRYQHFNEVEDKEKYVAVLEDNKLEFIPLSSVIRMRDFYSLEELSEADKNQKVRLVISSFKQFKESLSEITKYKNKFKQFKVKLDFKEDKKEVEIAKKDNTEKKKLEEILQEGIDKIEDIEVRKLIEESLNTQ
jgi:DNA repair exonuclease SbcCD nuclease subunit